MPERLPATSALHGSNLPPGVRVINVDLEGVVATEAQSTRTFTLRAEDWAKPITQPIYVVSEVESNSPTMHPSAPLRVEVVSSKETASVTPAKENTDHHGDDAPSPSRQGVPVLG